MEEFKYCNAIIRMHGEPNREVLEEAAIKFFKKMLKVKKQKRKEEQK